MYIINTCFINYNKIPTNCTKHILQTYFTNILNRCLIRILHFSINVTVFIILSGY